MGAQLVSCSFGRSYPDGFAPVSYPPPSEGHQAQAAAYLQAVMPLKSAGVLLMAAAGAPRRLAHARVVPSPWQRSFLLGSAGLVIFALHMALFGSSMSINAPWPHSQATMRSTLIC
jgi:hypothetical protein